jgi:hypothetical protein
LRETVLRGAAFFFEDAFAAIFFLAAPLALAATRVVADLRAALFCGTALFAFGRSVLAVARRFAAGLDERLADARDVERRSPFETALMGLQIEGLKRVKASRRCGRRIT